MEIVGTQDNATFTEMCLVRDHPGGQAAVNISFRVHLPSDRRGDFRDLKELADLIEDLIRREDSRLQEKLEEALKIKVGRSRWFWFTCAHVCVCACHVVCACCL